MIRKNQRGQKRKLKALLRNIMQIEPFINSECKYECFRVPCGIFISSHKTSGKIKTEFCKAWLDKTAEIISKKPCNIPFCKVFAILDEGDLWRSQINIFYDENYYNSFWSRNSEEQKWSPIIKEGRSFLQKRNIKSNLKEKGYIETINDVDYHRKTTLWFYGDID